MTEQAKSPQEKLMNARREHFVRKSGRLLKQAMYEKDAARRTRLIALAERARHLAGK